MPDGVEVLAFDVGETLIDESRMWAEHAREVGASPFTLMATLGALIERGRDHREVWAALGTRTPTRPVIPTLSDSRHAGVGPERIMYVGDRLDNDIRPARAAGMRTAFLRRGPWGLIQSRRHTVAADLVLDSLEQLTGLLTERGMGPCP